LPVTYTLSHATLFRSRQAGANRGWPTTGAWIVLPAVHGDRPAGPEEDRDEPATEEPGDGEVVDLPPDGGADQQRVDEVVRVVDADRKSTRLNSSHVAI